MKYAHMKVLFILEFRINILSLSHIKNSYHNIIHNVYQSSHSYKNYYKTTQNGISNLEMNHMIIMAGENYYNKFLIIN